MFPGSSSAGWSCDGLLGSLRSRWAGQESSSFLSFLSPAVFSRLPWGLWGFFFGILKWRCQTRYMLCRHGGMSVQPLRLWSAGAHGATGMLTTLELWLSTQRMPLNCSLNSWAQRPSASVIHRANFRVMPSARPAANFHCLNKGIKTWTENNKFAWEGYRSCQTDFSSV